MKCHRFDVLSVYMLWKDFVNCLSVSKIIASQSVFSNMQVHFFSLKTFYFESFQSA